MIQSPLSYLAGFAKNSSMRQSSLCVVRFLLLNQTLLLAGKNGGTLPDPLFEYVFSPLLEVHALQRILPRPLLT